MTRMGHDDGAECVCISEHNPAPMELTHHHVWPLGMGGPDTPDNLVWLCPTAHYNVHELLRWFIRYNGDLTFRDATVMYDVPVNRYIFAVARLGWLRFSRRDL